MSKQPPAVDASLRVASSWRSWDQGTKALAFMCALLPGMLVQTVFRYFEPFPAGVVPIAYLAIAAIIMTVLQASGEVSVDRDGLEHSWLGRTRRYSWRDVQELRQRVGREGGEPTLEIVLVAGGVSRIPLPEQAELASQLLAFAQERLQAFRSRVPSERLPALDRGGRDARDWVRHLRGMAGGSASHAREGYVSTDALLRVAEDPDQPALARASAVVAVLSQLSPDEIDRVRIIASSADDSLRSALEGALDPAAEDEAVAEALLALERRDASAER